MKNNKDYYKILGVDKNANENDIKKAYRKLVVQYHPDKTNGDKVKEERFKEISEAYDILSNPQKKQKYDNPQSDFSSFFNGFNGFSGFSNNPFQNIYNQYQQQFEQLNLGISLKFTLSDIYNNKCRDFVYKRKKPCTCDNGSEFSNDKCEMCDGRGEIANKECVYCNGHGRLKINCSKCNGTNVLLQDETYNLNMNIFNFLNPMRFEIRNMGNYSHKNKNNIGSLIVNTSLDIDTPYKIDRYDLYYILDVHFQDAIDGGDVLYKHLDDKEYKIKIKPLSNNNDKLKMTNKGLMKNMNERGDLYFIINIIIDYSKLNINE